MFFVYLFFLGWLVHVTVRYAWKTAMKELSSIKTSTYEDISYSVPQKRSIEALEHINI